MRAAWLLLLAGCAAEPSVRLDALDAHSAKLGASASPGPHYGYVLVGSADATSLGGVPEELHGRHGSARFLPGRTGTKVVDGVFHFFATLSERDYFATLGLLNRDPDVRIDFAGANGSRIVAAGRVVAGKAFYGAGLEDVHPAWKTK